MWLRFRRPSLALAAFGLALGLTPLLTGQPQPTAAARLAAEARPAEAAARLVGAYRAEILRIIDGDTVEARVHVWLGQEIVTRVRLAGIDAPELRGHCASERERALAARQALARLVEGRSVTLAAIGPDKYFGRVVARLVTGDGIDASENLLSSGNAVSYGGGKRSDWCGGP
jgi:endonuclease YncB( thermonuclease family)